MIFFVFLRHERTILYYKHYFIDFFRSLDVGAQRKIAYVIEVLKTQYRPGENFVKHVREGVFELRAKHEGNIYRFFFYF